MQSLRMKRVVILFMLFGFFSLSSCKNVDNEFVIRDPGGAISSAELRLCGNRLNLTKFGSEMKGQMPITCEGEGSILVRLVDGKETSCRIGYVTPSAEQTFEFVVEDRQCR
jgi:hypothetical protein